MVTNQKVAIVTGSSTDIGLETSLELAKNGFHTYATVRNLDEKSIDITDKARNENLPLQAIQLDVNNEMSVIEGIIEYLRKREESMLQLIMQVLT